MFAPAVEAAREQTPEPTLEEVDAALETATVVASPAAGAEPQLELFG
jgi:hypothetical protein